MGHFIHMIWITWSRDRDHAYISVNFNCVITSLSQFLSSITEYFPIAKNRVINSFSCSCFCVCVKEKESYYALLCFYSCLLYSHKSCNSVVY